MPKMGINDDIEKLGSYLFDKTRRGLLAMLYNRPGEAFYVNQMVKDLGSGSGAVQRELRTATEAGLIIREKRGNLVLYRVNQESPIYNELKSIIEKTASGTARPDDLITQRFKINKEVLAEFCRKHNIDRLSLYGAVLQTNSGRKILSRYWWNFDPDTPPDLVSLTWKTNLPGWRSTR